MIEICRACLYLFNAEHVREASGTFSIIERASEGKGEAKFAGKSGCILIVAQPNSPLIWALKQRKCADGAFLTFDEAGSHLHIVELKGKIKLSVWAYVLHQFEGMYLTAIAVMRLLEIPNVVSVTCYLAAKEDAVTQAKDTAASPTLMKAPVGGVRTFGGLEAWNRNVVPLPFSVAAILVKGWKDAQGVVDFGTI